MKRNIGSKMTNASAKQAARSTTSGTDQRTGIRTTGVSQGSMAGLKNSKSALIQHADGGYNNKLNQITRYTRRSILDAANKSQSSFSGFGKLDSSSILDKRLTSQKDSSISVLAKKLNR